MVNDKLIIGLGIIASAIVGAVIDNVVFSSDKPATEKTGTEQTVKLDSAVPVTQVASENLNLTKEFQRENQKDSLKDSEKDTQSDTQSGTQQPIIIQNENDNSMSPFTAGILGYMLGNSNSNNEITREVHHNHYGNSNDNNRVRGSYTPKRADTPSVNYPKKIIGVPNQYYKKNVEVANIPQFKKSESTIQKKSFIGANDNKKPVKRPTFNWGKVYAKSAPQKKSSWFSGSRTKSSGSFFSGRSKSFFKRR